MEDLDKPDRKRILIRGIQMLIFGLFINLTLSIIALLAFVQFIWMLVKQERNPSIAMVGNLFNQWLPETVDFLLAESEEKPFPWKGLPRTKEKIQD